MSGEAVVGLTGRVHAVRIRSAGVRAAHIGVLDERRVRERVVRLDRQRHTTALAVELAELIAVQQIVDVAVALDDVEGAAQQHGVGQRHVEHALDFEQFEIAEARAHERFGLVRRFRRRVQHRAAGRVAAEQRALRAFQHLHGLEIVEGRGAADRERHFVQIRDHRRGRAAEGVGALPADRIRQRVVALRLTDRESRRRELQVRIGADRSFDQLLATRWR